MARHVPLWNTGAGVVLPVGARSPHPDPDRRRWLQRMAITLVGAGGPVCLTACAAAPGRPVEGPGRGSDGLTLPDWQGLGGGLWWLPAQAGDADAANRGQVVHLLLAEHDRRLWLMGSGPSPAFGRALGRSIADRFGRRLQVLISAAPRPEAVLGAAGLVVEAHWAHADVAAQMASRCADCTERLRLRLGEASDDLGPADPVRVPDHRFDGTTGRLGPWSWRAFDRGEAFTTTAWAHQEAGLVFAPGLIGDGDLPDGRDADLRRLAESVQALSRWPAPRPGGWRWLGEQGPVQGAQAPARTLAYWRALDAAVSDALERGESGEQVARALPGVSPAATARPLHALNWQRAWRQAEDRWLQRSLR